ncbi:MAG: hypothetical protein ACO3RV_10410, partial [Luteolibacter sp.]
MKARDHCDLLPGLATWDPSPLRARLRKEGYQRQVLETLGLPERWIHSVAPRAALTRHVGKGTSLECLIRLFTLGDSLAGEDALHALGDAVHGLLEIAFLEAGGGEIRSCYQLVPVDDGWIACDFHRRQGDDADDYVMGIGPSSLLLASLVPMTGRRALELASGVGWLSGKLAANGMQVIASDVN